MKAQTSHDVETRLRAAIDAGDTEVIYECGRILDQLDAQRPNPQLLASALWYAEQGLHIFPIQPGAKVPFPGSRGFKDATTDLATVRAWWAKNPDANIGIATGHVVDVIDIDGPMGVKSWANMAGADDDINTLPPILGKVSTPRPGGNHLYVAATGDGNSAGIFPGVDYRGLGGYVVAPPSINHEGVAYTWYQPLELGSFGDAA